MMKKVILIILVFTMIIGMCGFTSPRAIDYSDVIEELEDEGFTRRGDVWTYEEYDIYDDDGHLYWIVAWYDIIENRGVMTVCGYVDEDDGFGPRNHAMRYEMTWDYDECDFVVTDSAEFTR